MKEAVARKGHMPEHRNRVDGQQEHRALAQGDRGVTAGLQLGVAVAHGSLCSGATQAQHPVPSI